MTFYTAFKTKLTSIATCTKGVAYIELAIVLPVLIFMFLGVVELSLYILIVQKEEKTVSTISDFVTNLQPSAEAQLSLVQNVVNEIMTPYNSASNYKFFITDIYYASGGAPTQQWVYCGGNLNGQASTVTLSGTTVTVNGQPITMNSGDEAIVTEFYYSFTPAFGDTIIPPAIIYRSAVYPPRNTAGLNTYTSTCP